MGNFVKKNKLNICLFLLGSALMVLALCLFGKSSPYVQIAWLLWATVILAKSLNINKILLTSSSMEIAIDEVKKIKSDLEHTLPILLPLIARIAVSDQASKIIPGKPYVYVYGLMKSIENSESYSEPEKKEFTKDLKWVVLIWIFSRMCRTELIEKLTREEHLLNDKLTGIRTELNNILQTYTHNFIWLSEQVRALNNPDITDKLNHQEKLQYQSIIRGHAEAISNFITNSSIDENLFTTGKLNIVS